MKLCTKCKQEKPLSAFYVKRWRGTERLTSACCACINQGKRHDIRTCAQNQKYFAGNKDRINLRRSELRATKAAALPPKPPRPAKFISHKERVRLCELWNSRTPMTLRDIATVLGCDRSLVGILEKSAMGKIRRELGKDQ